MDILKLFGLGVTLLVLLVLVRKNNTEMGVVFSLVVGVFIFTLCIPHLTVVVELIRKIGSHSAISSGALIPMLKVVAIAIISQFVVDLSIDAGENALAQKLEFGGKLLILVTAMPIILQLLEAIMTLM